MKSYLFRRDSNTCSKEQASLYGTRSALARNPKLCENTRDYKDVCYFSYAEDVKDKNVCNKILFPPMREECIKLIK